MFQGLKVTVLVSDAALQAAGACAACDLFLSPWFLAAREWTQRHRSHSEVDEWFVVTAAHGLVDPHAPLEPYITTVQDMTASGRSTWAQRVAVQCVQVVAPPRVVVLMTNNIVTGVLQDLLRCSGYSVCTPLVHMNTAAQRVWMEDSMDVELNLEELQAEIAAMSDEEIARAVLSINRVGAPSMARQVEREKTNRTALKNLRKLMAETGKTLDEVLADIQAGRL